MIITLKSAPTVTIEPQLTHNTTGEQMFHLVPESNVTINANSGGWAGQPYVIKIGTSDTSRTVTFGANFRASGPLSTGITPDKIFLVTFVSDGIALIEKSRSAAAL